VLKMIGQYKLGFDHFRGKPPEEDFGRSGLPVSRIAVLSVVSILLFFAIMAVPAVSSARVDVGIAVSFAPPAIPIYVQPPLPGPDYIWIPGYWAWDPGIGYYWVPGTWVLAPFPGALWTPGYWGWNDGVYVWYGGYWGLTVGFYGGINYGFGYNGYGYYGGYWDHGAFYYNRAVNNISVTNITNVYNKPVSAVATTSRVSYNGGPGGITVRPTTEQLAAARQKHSAATEVQLRNERTARNDPRQRAALNHGRPIVAATAKPGVFKGSGVVKASRAGAPYKEVHSGKVVGPNAHVRPSRSSGSIERSPRVTMPKKVSPPAHVERRAATRNEHVGKPEHRLKEAQPIPKHSDVAGPKSNFRSHVRPVNPSGGIEKSPRVTMPKKASPPARVERMVPRNEHAGRPEHRPKEARHGGEKSKRCC
jgi:hypothetical protein